TGRGDRPGSVARPGIWRSGSEQFYPGAGWFRRFRRSWERRPWADDLFTLIRRLRPRRDFMRNAGRIGENGAFAKAGVGSDGSHYGMLPGFFDDHAAVFRHPEMRIAQILQRACESPEISCYCDRVDALARELRQARPPKQSMTFDSYLEYLESS